MPKITLNQGFVDSQATCPPEKARIDFYDDKVVGLSLKVLVSGHKAFYVRYRNARGKLVERKLGNAAAMKLTAENRRDLLEVLEDRHGRRSTIATSQLPIEEWHGVIGDATLADAILDRLVHNAYKINLRGESMRKQQARLTGTGTSE